MLLSIALILICGLSANYLFKKLNLPGLLGILIFGIVLGPFALNLISTDILMISADLRQIALIIILARAGLSLDFNDLKRLGRPAILLCFVPALFEIAAMAVLGPIFLNISLLDSLLLGSVIGAVSPAVIVPKMITIMDEGYGTEKGIPQLLLAGASVDDVFVLVLFTSFLSLSMGEGVSALTLLSIPLSIISGVIGGLLAGLLLNVVFSHFRVDNISQTIIFLGSSLFLVALEDLLAVYLPFSGLLAVMAVGMYIYKKNQSRALMLKQQFGKLWVLAEIILFSLVGASVNINYLLNAGYSMIILLLAVMLVRMLGVWVSLLGCGLNNKEKLFSMIAYIPKATVQAAIGAIPLASGHPQGELILTVAVLSIIIFAPLGAIGIDASYRRLLSLPHKDSPVRK